MLWECHRCNGFEGEELTEGGVLGASNDEARVMWTESGATLPVWPSQHALRAKARRWSKEVREKRKARKDRKR